MAKKTEVKKEVAPTKKTEASKATSVVKGKEYPSPDIRGPMPENAHPDSTFSSGTHNDWTH